MDDTLDVLMDFLECAVHTILYARQIYPSHLFEQRMKYGDSQLKFPSGLINRSDTVLHRSD